MASIVVTSNHDTDHVRLIVASEGRVARNLITWSVPISDDVEENETEGKVASKLRKKATNEDSKYDKAQQADPTNNTGSSQDRSESSSSRLSSKSYLSRDQIIKNNEMCLRARYWSYLLENLHRAVDELYCTCDNDESVKECEEVIMMLKNCTRDFKSLITKIRILKENDRCRRHSLAWEVRKISPCKSTSPPTSARRSPVPSISRSGDGFDEGSNNEIQQRLCTANMTDNTPLSHAINSEVNENDDGWRVVTRGKKRTKSGQQYTSNDRNSNDATISDKFQNISPRKADVCQPVSSSCEYNKEYKHMKNVTGVPKDRTDSMNTIDLWTVDDNDLCMCPACEEAHRMEINCEFDAMTAERYRQEFNESNLLASSWNSDMLDESMSGNDVGRRPGKAVDIHQRLSSPSRLKSRSELLKISEERMIKAERLRLKFLEEKHCRFKAITEKVQRVRQTKHGIIASIDINTQEKMRRAEEKRQNVLKEKIRKAQEEEAKVNEIAFINSLEAQNRKMEVMEKNQVLEARLQDIQEERQRKREEQLAKEEAAQERRKALAAERQARLDEISLKRQEQEEKWHRERQERERSRELAAEERRRERESKVIARNIALQTAADELQKKIEMKQIESSKRHEMKIEEVKEKAASYARHSVMDDCIEASPSDSRRCCDVCNAEMSSEKLLDAHRRSQNHKKKLKQKLNAAKADRLNKEGGTNNDEEAQSKAKQRKKKIKKYKQKVTSRGITYEKTLTLDVLLSTETRTKFSVIMSEIDSAVKLSSTNPNDPALLLLAERALPILKANLPQSTDRIDDSNNEDEELNKMNCVLSAVSECLVMISNRNELPENSKLERMICSTVSCMLEICNRSPRYCWFFYHGRAIAAFISIVGLFLEESRSNTPRSHCAPFNLPVYIITSIKALTSILASSMRYKSIDLAGGRNAVTLDHFSQRSQDIASYLTSTDLWRTTGYFANNLKSLDDDVTLHEDGLAVLSLLHTLTWCQISCPIIIKRKATPSTPFFAFITESELGGIVLLMYATVHHYFTTPNALSTSMSTKANSVLLGCLKSLNCLFVLNLVGTQNLLRNENVFVQFRSVTSCLFRQVSSDCCILCDEVIDEAVVAIGYFALMNQENQDLLQSGTSPTVLQQLASLPFSYFSCREKQDVLYPTLVAACLNHCTNKTVLQRDINCQVLSDYCQEFCDADQRTRQSDQSSRSCTISLRMDPWLRLPSDVARIAVDFCKEK